MLLRELRVGTLGIAVGVVAVTLDWLDFRAGEGGLLASVTEPRVSVSLFSSVAFRSLS